MSKQVDERVVSMQFDNKNFEKNVSTTMSTLDKFKQKLNLKGASKGLEEVNAAAKKVDMNGLANGVETVRTKFSAMEVIGVTALANITNSAVNAGKRIVSALTIDPVKTGFQEYETQMDAVQTILANTESKGSTLADVNAALDELNKYADKTIYNFTQMTKNIGTFTAAGVELDTSVSAIQGIANLAAVSGANAQQASTVMYQLSQALAAGKINLMDWNSVVNNSMGGELFQNALIRTSEVMGTGAKKAIADYGTFRESLSKTGWLTSEVLTETLKQISGAYTEADLIAQGFTASQAKEITKLAETATNAATKVKTFTQLWDVLKESAQSGWSQTWKLIVGDFEQAKALLTPLADFLTGIVNRMSDFRNKIVALVMGNPLAELIKRVSSMTDTVKSAMKPLKDYADIVDRIIRGEFGNQGDKGDRNYRKKLVEAAGYDYAVAQTLVNEKLGCSLRLTDDLSEAMGKQNKTQAKTIEQLAEMSDAQLKALGYTEEQINALRQLAKYAKEAGMPLSEFIESVDQMDGRTMIIETFKNAGKGLVTVCNALKDAWLKVFPVSAESIAMRIYGALAKLYDFSKRWDISKDTDTIEKLTSTFRGLFAILDIIRIVVGGPISLVLKVLGKILASLNIPILDVTAAIGDALWAFDQWLFKNNFIIKGLTKCASVIKTWVQQFLAMPEVQQAIEKVKQKFVELWEYLQKKFSGGKDFLSGLVKQVQNGELRIGEAIHIVLKKIGSFGQKFFDKAVEIGKNIIDGISKGLSDKKDSVLEKIKGVGESLITFVKDILGIHSPSTEFIEIGKNIMAGLIVGIGSIKILSVVSNIAKAIGGLGSVLDGVGDVLSGVGTVLVKSARGIGKIMKSTAKVVRKFAKVLGSVGNLINAKALRSVAIAIAILAGSVAVLAMLDPGRVWSAVGVIVVLAGVLGGLMAAINKFGMAGPAGIKEAITGVKAFGQLASSLLMISGSLLMLAVSLRIIGGMEWSEFGVAAAGIVLLGLVLAGLMRMTKYSGERLYMLRETILAFGGAMLMLAVAMRIMGGMEWNEFGVAAAGIALLGVVVAGLIWATKLAGPFAGTIGNTILAISGAIAILAVALRLMGGMEWSEFGVAAAGIALLTGIVLLLIAVVKKAGPQVAAIGATLLAISGAMAILTITAKMIAGMEWGDIAKAAVGLAGLVVIIRMMIKAVKLAGPNVAAIGATLLAVSGAMAILTITAKMIAGMEWGDIAKAAAGLAGLVVIIRMMIQAVKIAGKDTPKIALTLLAVSAAIGILAGVSVLLSLVELGALAKGVAAVGFLSAFMIGLIKATRGAADCMKNLIVMTVAIGVMTGAVIALSCLDPAKVAVAAGAMGIVMGMFAVMELAGKNATGSIGPLIVMTVAIGMMAGALYLLAQLPVEASLGAAAALSVLMISLSACLIILSGVGQFASSALMGVLALLAMTAPLLAFVGILALMQNIQNVIPSVMALVTLTTAMTLLLIPLTIVGAFGLAGLPYLGVLALLAMAVPLLAFVGMLALMQNIQNATQNAMILVTLMTTMTKCLVAVSLVAPLALVGVAAIRAMVMVITEVGILMTAIGALVDKFPQLETFLDKGVPILEKIGYAIGSVLGNMVAGFAVSAMSGLPQMGLLLSQFMINAMPFIVGAKMIDPATMDGVKSLAEVILILTAADVIQGLTSWLTGGSSITKFGEEIAAFGPYLRTFADSVAGINGESVQAAANAAKALAEMTATIPNEGGVAGWFAGENSIVKFAAELPILGMGLKLFSDSVAGINAENISAAADAAKAITEMTASIPNEGGVAAWFAGENSISKFADDLPKLATGIKGFSDNVSGINVESVHGAVEAAKAIVEMSKNIPNEGGVVSWFTGDNSIANFSSQLGTLGSAIATFSTNVGAANVANIDKAVKATKSLVDLLAADVSASIDTMKNFGKELKDFGGKIADFCKKMSGIKDNAISSAVSKFKELANTATTLSADSITSLTNFGDALVDVAEKGVKQFVSALNSKEVKSNAEEAVSDLVSATADKIKTITNKLKFKSAGKYLVEGLAEGIKANKSAATKAAQNVADAVETIIRAAWKVNSPSKLFYGIALGVPEGIENAFGDGVYGVKSSAGELADTASNGFGNAIQKIVDFINSDMDTQPTIRPVLDLSDVQSGASTLNGMFSGNRVLAISAPNVGAIAASMSGRQNGNGDLISAINKLAKSNSKSGDTYQINGINYSEGSDVADAIHTLVRAAKMEGRT